MYQQINMYQPVFRRQPKIFSTATLLKIIGVIVVLLFALYTNAHSTMKGLQRISADLALTYNQLDARLVAVKSTGAVTVDASASEEISTLQTQIRDQNALLEHVDSLVANSNTGFGDIFESLARTSLPGLWLTGIQLNEDGSIELSGTAHDPAFVPRYLQLIARHSSLNMLSSGSVNLMRAESTGRDINFVISYSAPGVEH